MKLDNSAIGKPCPKCRREITAEVVSDAKNRKVENAIASTKKAKASGNRVGRKSDMDWEIVAEMRQAYMKVSDIAKVFGVSRSYISRELKRRGVK